MVGYQDRQDDRILDTDRTLLHDGTYAELNALDDAPDWKNAYQLYVAMYALGDKYDITVLKYSAMVSFKELITRSQSDLVIY